MLKFFAITSLSVGIIATCLAIAKPALGFEQITTGITDTATGLGLPMNDDATAAIDAWAFIINSLLAFGGIIFLVVIIYGGWLWMTAAGNSDAVAKGKQLMLQASIGMIILLGARIIVEFVLYNIPTEDAAPAAPTTGSAATPTIERTGGADDGGNISR